MDFEFFIANRYLKSKRKTGFISLITYISILGVMIGVAALIIVLSVMNGFEMEVRSRFIGFSSHIDLTRFWSEPFRNDENIIEKIRKIDHIVGISPYVREKALIIHKGNKEGLQVIGVDSQTISEVSDIEEDIIYGVFEIGEVRLDSARVYPGIVLGKYLADKLNVDLGDRIQILSPSGISPIMTRMPPLMTFAVTGFFETGIHDLDVLNAYISLDRAQRLFQLGAGYIRGLEIKLDDLDLADGVKTALQDSLGYPYRASTWFDKNPNLFAWMQMEKWTAFIVLSLIIMVAAFNIISTLIMIVLEKTKEIGILKSLGASSRSLMKIFVYEGLVSGVIGTVLGCLIGFGLCWSQLQYQWFALPGDVYIISVLPVLMQPLDFVAIASAAILISFLATIYPAHKASRLDPVEAIRYE
jgi:lipoprotein-releasing system permease protein